VKAKMRMKQVATVSTSESVHNLKTDGCKLRARGSTGA
jgi:hypothetical protein